MSVFLTQPERVGEGIPLAVKDLFDTAGVRTTYGSILLGDHVPERTAGGGVARVEVVSARNSPEVDDRGSMSAEWPLVKAGSKGGAVRALQRLLLHRGSELEVDGSFGPETEKALKAFQSANGLDADGAAGTKTWSKLVVPVRSGQRGEPVLAVQELLGVSADGTFGPETEKATRRFQKKVHLAVDGIVGPHTWELLIVES